MSQLLNRAATLTLTKPNGSTVIIRGLRIKFKIKKTIKEGPDSSTISVYNMNESTRAEFGKLPLHAQLDVGYLDEVARIFSGDITYAASELDPGAKSWITTLSIGDGAVTYNNSLVTRSFGAGTDARTAVTEIARTMGLKVPTSLAEAKEFSRQFVSGLTLHGPSRLAMTKVMPAGFGWSMQNGQLVILGKGQDLGNTAILIAKRTGMIEVPTMNAPKKPGDSPTLKVKTRIYPGLLPGGLIKLESSRLNGLFALSEVTHDGDTHDKTWVSELEAEPR